MVSIREAKDAHGDNIETEMRQIPTESLLHCQSSDPIDRKTKPTDRQKKMK